MNVKVMIVDDSPFSRMMIGEVLREAGYEVVGEAGSIEGMVDVYQECRPDVVTMDIAMPGADGFECSRELRANDPKVKIVLISSMKDEDLEVEAKRVGVCGYIEKPIDGEKLINVIENVLSPDVLFEELMERGFATFKEALSQNITRMAKTTVHFTPIECAQSLYVSQGVTAVIGIIGQSSGTMIMDLSVETAEKVTEALLKRPAKNKEEVLAMVGELANIVSGVACSMLNKKDKAFGLRVSPPSLFHGNVAEIISPSVRLQKTVAMTDFGSIFLGVGFKKGTRLWM